MQVQGGGLIGVAKWTQTVIEKYIKSFWPANGLASSLLNELWRMFGRWRRPCLVLFKDFMQILSKEAAVKC